MKSGPEPTKNAATFEKRIRSQLDDLLTLRDEIRLHLHLARMDVRDRFRELEPKIERLEKEVLVAAEDAGDLLVDTITKMTKALRSIRAETTPPPN